MIFSKHVPTLFRVLRTNEGLGRNKLLCPAAGTDLSRPIQEKVFDHVTNGSSSFYRSPLISFTSELNVALAFGGILSPIAVVRPELIPVEHIQYLDKEYLRQTCITDKHAIARSRRSDEVVVDCNVAFDEILDIKIKECRSKFWFPEDEVFFPKASVDLFSNMQTVDRLGGANKRLFQVSIGGRRYTARCPRPNVCLDKPLLFDDALVEQSKREYASFCLYRELTLPEPLVPRCALYTFELEYMPIKDCVPMNGTFKWSLLLMEELKHLRNTAPDVIKGAATRLFGPDLLLGNWGCADGDSYEELADNFIYAKTLSSNKTIRVAVDRSLGGTYPEDNSKKGRKHPVLFDDTTADLKVSLLKKWKQLFGYVSDKEVTQSIIDVRLDRPGNFERVKTIAEYADWPSYCNMQRSGSISDVIGRRKDHLLEKLPYHYASAASKQCPQPRDGHAAVGFSSSDTMIIMGGNTSRGPVKDVWMVDMNDVNSFAWEKMSDIPGGGRFSFSAHSWESHGSRFVIIFGGGNKRPGPMHGDLLVFDVDRNAWKSLDLPKGYKIPARCRHASTWRVIEEAGTAVMHVIGGHDEMSKRKDVYKIVMKHAPGSIPKISSCKRMPDLPTPIHRAFAFCPEKDDRIILLGGLGKGTELKHLLTVNEAGTGSTILTHGSLDAQLPESLDLSGFGAVVDETGGQPRVVLLGGGQTKGARAHDKSLGRSMGLAPACEQPFRMLSLCRTVDERQREEWTWNIDKKHEELDEPYRLPVRTSWSACLINHKIVLFGGRHGKEFSNKIIILQLRPDFVNAREEILESARAMKLNLEELERKWGPDQDICEDICGILEIRGNK